ncbi:MAG: 50S ribosomal protein L22, partial [Anaerolineales bacterium]
SARKARYVMDLVRGLPVEKALNDLKFSLKRATPMVSKVIRSALANATQEGGLEKANLFIAEALVDVGPQIKRWKARAMGRPRPRMRRTCHLSVVLRERKTEGKAKAPRRSPAAAVPAGSPPGSGASPPEPRPAPEGAGASSGSEAAASPKTQPSAKGGR